MQHTDLVDHVALSGRKLERANCRNRGGQLRYRPVDNGETYLLVPARKRNPRPPQDPENRPEKTTRRTYPIKGPAAETMSARRNSGKVAPQTRVKVEESIAQHDLIR